MSNGKEQIDQHLERNFKKVNIKKCFYDLIILCNNYFLNKSQRVTNKNLKWTKNFICFCSDLLFYDIKKT